MNEHSDSSAPKPDDASSRPAPPLTPAAEATADPFAAPGGATDKPAADSAAEPAADATEPSTGTGTPGVVGADPSVLAAAAGIRPSSEPGANVPPTAPLAAGAQTGTDDHPLAASAAEQPAGRTPSEPGASVSPTAPLAAGAQPGTEDHPRTGGPAEAGGRPASEPVTRPVAAGPLPPRMEPRGPGAPGGAPPPAGPPTAAFPAGPPPLGGPPFATAPPRKKSKTPALLVGALVIALGAGAAGGVAGYALSDVNGGNDSSSPSELVADGSTISDIAKKVQPSVVSIATEQAGGSGVVYDDEGHIITNNHVAETAQGGKLEVTFADGTTAAASVVGTDPAGDLAVIKVENVANLTPIEMGDSGSLDVGDTVLAIGSPLGLDGSVTSGIVSALDRTVQAGGGEQGGQTTTLNGLIQTDAAINPGNSGGALVNGKGELIGINTVIATTGSSEGSVGLGFAIPSSTVGSTADQIIEGGDVEHGYLGVSVTDNVSGSQGAVVNEVADDSPADKAGLKRGDVITAIDGEQVGGAADVGALVQGAKPGTKVEIKYNRDGKESTATAELGSTGSTN